MGLILLVLLIALAFGGLGFASHIFWIVAAVVFVAWLVGSGVAEAKGLAPGPVGIDGESEPWRTNSHSGGLTHTALLTQAGKDELTSTMWDHAQCWTRLELSGLIGSLQAWTSTLWPVPPREEMPSISRSWRAGSRIRTPPTGPANWGGTSFSAGKDFQHRLWLNPEPQRHPPDLLEFVNLFGFEGPLPREARGVG